MYQFFEEDRLERETYEDIQVEGVSVHPRLFWLEDLGFSCAFTLFPPDAYKFSYLRVLIEAAGGIVLSKLDPYTIPLVDDYFIECTGSKYSNSPVPEDHFSSKFINDSIVADKILDLNEYRCSQSKYDDFDSNSILLNRLEWSQLPLRNVGRTKKEYPENRKLRKRSLVDTNGDTYDFDKSLPSASQNHTGLQRVITRQVTPHISPPSTSQNSPAVVVEAGPSTKNGFKRPEPPTGPTVNLGVRCSPPTTSKRSTQQRDISVAPTLREPGREIVAPLSPIHDISDDDSNADRVSVSSRVTYTDCRREFRRPYSTEDGRKILDVIITNKWYSNYMGVSIWKEMEDMELFSIFRPWQGMKEHFVKKILPNLSHHKYGLTQENLQRFEKAKHTIKNSNRQPARPVSAPQLKTRRLPLI